MISNAYDCQGKVRRHVMSIKSTERINVPLSIYVLVLETDVITNVHMNEFSHLGPRAMGRYTRPAL
jgi:hypothetical protein